MKFLQNIAFFLLLLAASCGKAQDKTKFSKEALAEEMIDVNGEQILFAEVISKYKGKRVVIDVWASWCSDCIGGMPKVKELQKEYGDAVFLFLSVDKDYTSWKKGIEKYNVLGEHYFIPAGWKSDFNNSIDLDWIPRYMVVDESGRIKLHKATKASDKKIEKAIKS
ncbi:TlpA disulfide reductase family protein [Flavicella sp.]|uniref:TlpA family protein disulfide reductase n=1 Tax=Flavicella sp. TaxID=2957742 RepID=UPI0026162CA3|nr:TlpA disulfide reductase family protein [Flavicella sp.]MDG1805530.1 TlpA disulfide reductase family protein [Flavicella sp.]MDG2280964.1 TlpA disulfide reductase family protein [Flavicella sp.]